MGARPASRPLRGRWIRQPQRPDRGPHERRSDLTRAAATTALLVLICALPAGAQGLSIWVDGATSLATPPAGVTADPSQYGLFGGRLQSEFGWGGATFSGRYGHALTGGTARWLQGDGAVSTGTRMGSLGLRANLSAFGLRYLDPFQYDAGGLDLRPAVSYPVGRLVVSATPRLALGAWSSSGGGTSVTGDLRVAGGELDVHRSFGSASLVASAAALSVENGVTLGTFLRAGGYVVVDRGRWSASGQLQVQRTPLETEVGGGVQASMTVLPGVEIRTYAGRRVRDPLFGTAGSFGFSLSVAARAVRWTPPQPPPVVAIGQAEAEGRRVRFAIRAPEADTVQLTGDFTGWDPVPMKHTDDGWWRANRVLLPGLHHFGFLVDGQWVVPQDAPGLVEDGWGRRNASIVIEP